MSSAPALKSTAAAKPASNLPIVIVAVAAVVLIFAAIGLVMAFQQPEETLAVGYGRRDGFHYSTSVNGTGVFAEMCRKHGHKVSVVTRLSPSVRRKAQVIVWFPNDFEPPTAEQRKFFETWLEQTPDARLVYVGRDYNAAPDYWRDAQAIAAPQDLPRIARERAMADAEWIAHRAQISKSTYGYWFASRNGQKRQSQGDFSGPWASSFDPQGTHLTLESQLAIPIPADLTGVTDVDSDLHYESLLSNGADQWAFAVEKDHWPDSKIIVISNGSFLLNYPLVNPEHRKLAENLIDTTTSYPGQHVVFLQSDKGGPPVLDKDEDPEGSQMITFFKIWPLNIIAFHLILVGMFYCVSRSIMFGRPRDPPMENPADFGRHVTALGELMASTGNLAMAEQRINDYVRQAKRASGKSHRDPVTEPAPNIPPPPTALPPLSASLTNPKF